MANAIHSNQLVVGNILDMLRRRGYQYNPVYDDMIGNYDAMYRHMNDNKDMMVIHGTRESSDEIMVFNIHGVEKFNADRRQIVERAFKDHRNKMNKGRGMGSPIPAELLPSESLAPMLEVIIVTKATVNTKKLADIMRINYMPSINIRVTLFRYSELRYNILESDLNSRYEIITDPDARDRIMAGLRVDRNDIMPISENEPSLRFIGATPGDLIRIIRPSPTAGTSIVYARVTGVPYTKEPRKA